MEYSSGRGNRQHLYSSDGIFGLPPALHPPHVRSAKSDVHPAPFPPLAAMTPSARTVCRALLATCAVAVACANVRQTQTGACRRFSNAGIDYADPNITVLSGADAKDSGACCAACAGYNDDHREGEGEGGQCALGVWHNLQPPLCVLKASSDHPVKGHLVIAWQPPAPEPQFRFGSTQTSGMVLQSVSLLVARAGARHVPVPVHVLVPVPACPCPPARSACDRVLAAGCSQLSSPVARSRDVLPRPPLRADHRPTAWRVWVAVCDVRAMCSPGRGLRCRACGVCASQATP